MSPQLDLNLNPEQPSELITHNSEEFFAALDRANRGDYHIEWIARVTGSNCGWKIKVRWR